MPLRLTASLTSKNELVSEPVAVFAEEGRVETTETSKSWVFITPKWVYKAKKTARDDLQDMVPLRARHDNTLTEIDLNRRLAPELHVGAVRVGRASDESLKLDRPRPETVDWLVNLPRRPKERMLDEQIVGGVPKSVLAARIDALMPVAFYRAAPKSRLNAEELMTVQEDQLKTARHVLLDPLFADHHTHALSIFETLNTLWPAITDRLDALVCTGAIVEGHGDLRPLHICLSDPPVIYDRIEWCADLAHQNQVERQIVRCTDFGCDGESAPQQSGDNCVLGIKFGQCRSKLLSDICTVSEDQRLVAHWQPLSVRR